MSWLSKVLGLDKHPAELNAINTVGATVLHGIEAAEPLALDLIKVLETVGKNPPTSPVSAISDVGAIVAVLDKGFPAQVEGVVNKAITTLGTKLGLTPAEIDTLVAEADSIMTVEFIAAGFIKGPTA